MKTKTLLLFLLLNCVYCAQTDTIFIELTNGNIRSYSVMDIREINLSGVPTGLKEQQLFQNVIKSFNLRHNYPNPFNPSTNIEYEIPYQGNVEIAIFDIRGRQIRSYTSSVQQAGVHKVIWDGRNDSGTPVSSGTYFCRVHFNDSYLTNKLLLLK